MTITTTIPLNPAIGHLVLDPVTNRLSVWDGKSWNFHLTASATVSRQMAPYGEARADDEQRMYLILCAILTPLLAMTSVMFALWWVLS